MMKGRIISLMAMTAMFSSPTISSELNIYLWEDTLSPRVIQAWNKTHDTKINTYHFDNDDERSLLLLDGATLPFDIIVLDNVSAQLFSSQSLFEDLTHLKGRENNDTRWIKACGTQAVPYFWGYVGIAYRKSKVSPPPSRWKDLIDIDDNLKGHVGLLDDSVETLLPALYSMNKSPLTASVSELKAAYNKLKKSVPDVLTFEYALSYIRSHADNNDLYMALSYSGDQFSLNRFFDDDDWNFALPEGRPYLWVDCLAINSHSTNKKQAQLFLEYLMKPEIAAMNALDIKGATPNQQAVKLLPDSYIQDQAIFLPDNMLSQSIVDSELSASNLSLRAKIINSVIEQHEAKQ